MLSILNVGAGDTKIVFDKDKPEERKKACRIVTDMLKRGYALLIQVGTRSGKPLYRRAKAFDPDTAEYIVFGEPADEPPARVKRKYTKRHERRYSAATTPATAVARSAGGMSDRTDSIELANLENLRRFDNHHNFRMGIARAAELKEEWAGIPMPLADFPLVVEPQYPKAKELMQIGRAAEEHAKAEAEDADIKVRNRFFSTHRRCDIIVMTMPDGKIDWGLHRAMHHLDQELGVIGASSAWGVEQEHAALQTLATLLRHHTFKHYLMTGQFLEKSERSGMMYLFRKLRPTIALREEGERLVIRAALCAHPIAYYANTWAGAMCPTDDVIAHLMMMRGDEHLYWKRCNQHPAWRPEAGL